MSIKNVTERCKSPKMRRMERTMDYCYKCGIKLPETVSYDVLVDIAVERRDSVMLDMLYQDVDTCGVNLIVDEAFVVESGERFEAAKTKQGRIREEAGDVNAKANEKAEKSLSDILGNMRVVKGFEGTPDNGMHMVKFSGEPEVKNGRDGAYITIDLEREDGLTWKTYVNVNDIPKMFQSISFSNNGMLAGMDGNKALQNVQKNFIRVWTMKKDDGKVVTYFLRSKYDAFAKYISYKANKEEEYKLWKRERADKEAAAKEAAELTKKAKQDEDIPF